MPFPDLTLQIARGIRYDTFPGAADWSEITKDLYEATITTGKQTDLGGFEAGKLDLILHNLERQYEPDYSGSTHYPYIRPDTWIRLFATVTGQERLGANALSFDGQDDFATASPSGSLTAPFTVEAWVNATAMAPYPGRVVFGTRGPSEHGFDMWLTSTGTHADIGSGTAWLTTGADTTGQSHLAGVWYHICYVVTLTSWTCFINGVQKGSGPLTGLALLYDATHRVGIGTHAGNTSSGSQYSWPGRIDDVRIWSVARSSIEIAATMNIELTGLEPGLVAYWKFNEGIGTQAADSASTLLGGGGNHGTLMNGTRWANEAYPQFTGLIDNPEPEWKLPSKVKVVATDAIAVMATKTLGTPWQAETRKDGPLLHWTFREDAVDDPVADDSGNGRSGRYFGAPTFGQASPIFDKNDKSIRLPLWSDHVYGGEFFGGIDPFTVSFWLRTTASSEYVAFTMGRAPGQTAGHGGGITIGQDGSNRLFFRTDGIDGTTASIITTTPIFNQDWVLITATREANGTMRVYSNGVERGSLTGTAAKILPTRPIWLGGYNSNTGDFDEVLIYNKALTAADVSRHYNSRLGWPNDTSGTRINRLLDHVGYPASKRQIDPGNTLLQPVEEIGNILAHARLVELTESGGLYALGDGTIRFRERHALLRAPYTEPQFTIGRGVGELPYAEVVPDTSAALIRNEVEMQREGGTVQRALDAATPFTIRTYKRTGLQHANDNDVRDQVFFTLDRYKDFKMRFKEVHMRPGAASDIGYWDALLGLLLQDRIRVRRSPPAGAGGGIVERQAHIIGIVQRITPGRRWDTVWRLGDADTREFWLVGVAGRSEVGVTTRIGY